MKTKLIALLLLLSLSIIVTGCSRPASAPGPDETLVGGDGDEHGCIGSAGYSWCEPVQKCLEESEPCLGGSAAKPEPEPENPPIDYSYGLFLEYVGSGFAGSSVYGSERIPFDIDSNDKVVSPGGHFNISGTEAGYKVHGTVNIHEMSGNLFWDKHNKQWMINLDLKPSIDNYIWTDELGQTMDHSMDEWEMPIVMEFKDGAVFEMAGMVFKFTLQDIPLWPIPLID